MQLDSVMVRAGSLADVRRLQRAGGEVWQECGQVTEAGGIRWAYWLVKVPAAAAVRLQLVTPGAECGELVDATPAKAKSGKGTRGGTHRQTSGDKRQRQESQGSQGSQPKAATAATVTKAAHRARGNTTAAVGVS